MILISKIVSSSLLGQKADRARDFLKRNGIINSMKSIIFFVTLTVFAECGYALNGNGEPCATGRDLFNASIAFKFPYLGDDGWEFVTCDNFNNGVATVFVNGQTNTWTILSPDKPLYKFGRYSCGFMREDRHDGTHAIYTGLFFNGVMVGAEHLREISHSERHQWLEHRHQWHELDDVPDDIRKIGGGEWETGFIVWPKCFDKLIDVSQMINDHRQPFEPSLECLRWLKSATEKDIHDKWGQVQNIIDSIDPTYLTDQTDRTNSIHEFSVSTRKMSAVLRLKNQFWQILLRWKILHAKSNGEKRAVLDVESVMEQIQKKCDDARRGVRGYHVLPDWGECLIQEDLLESWLLKGDDATYWNKVAFMKGVIDGHNLEFQFGFATVDLPEAKDEYGYEEEPLILFKVRNDFYFYNGYVYAKVIGDRPGRCYYMPCSYEPPTYVVRVDGTGKIVNWYRYPKQAKTLKEFLEPKPNHFPANQVELIGTPCWTMPEEAELLCESGELALFAGETAEDSAYNEVRKTESLAPYRNSLFRNSLFLRHRRANGTEAWRVLLSTGTNWREAAGMNEWSSGRAQDMKDCFYVFKASFSSDGRRLWLVCDPHTYTYSVVCSYDIYNQTFRVLIDGDTADEQPDGTILVKNKKSYLSDDNGEPLGARFHDVWITPDGKVVRKGKLKTAEEVD